MSFRARASEADTVIPPSVSKLGHITPMEWKVDSTSGYLVFPEFGK